MADLTITAVASVPGKYIAYEEARPVSEAMQLGNVVRVDRGVWHKSSALNSTAYRFEGVLPAAVPAGGVTAGIKEGFVQLTGPTLTPGGLYFVSQYAGRIMPYSDFQNGDDIGIVGIASTSSIMWIGPIRHQTPTGFDGVSATPTGAISGAPTVEVGSMRSIRAGQALLMGNLVWFDLTTPSPYVANKLEATSSLAGSRLVAGVATTNIAANQVGLVYTSGLLTFAGQTIVRGHVYIAGSTPGTIVPYTDVQNGWKVRCIGIGHTNNRLAFLSNLQRALAYNFTYQG